MRMTREVCSRDMPAAEPEPLTTCEFMTTLPPHLIAVADRALAATGRAPRRGCDSCGRPPRRTAALPGSATRSRRDTVQAVARAGQPPGKRVRAAAPACSEN